MEHCFLGNRYSDILIIRPADKDEIDSFEKEYSLIKTFSGKDPFMAFVLTDNWNKDLSPWDAPPVFGNEAFGHGAADTLKYITDILIPEIKEDIGDHKEMYLGGYSLGALFSLWASYNTNIFKGIAAASPSMWFPGFLDYMMEHAPKTEKIYLSLGDREEKTKNPVMATVGQCVKAAYEHLKKDLSESVTLEWNPGNHFKDPDIRMAKGFSYLLN